MDNVRTRLRVQAASRNRKILLGVIALIFIVICAFALEKTIGSRITDVVIEKSAITDEKAIFIPLNMLDTKIIAVIASDGTYRLAFDDCIGCYYERGKHGRFSNNSDNTGLVCDICGIEIMYDDMGFLTEESMPYPIAETEIISNEDNFVIPEKYLINKKAVLENLRKGKK